MRRLLATAAAACLGALAALSAAPSAPQTPPPAQQQVPPVFRGEVDVIRLDVTVLDQERRPVRGLTADNFQVFEDGKLQRLVAVSEVDVAEDDIAPSAWMRHVAPDVTSNNLVDQVGEGRVFAIVMDDRNVPWDAVDMIQSARNIGRYIVESLGPSDVAAIVFPVQAGRTQDFTSDRSKLFDAIAAFDPPEPDRYIVPRQLTPPQGGADMPYRTSPVLMRNDCQRAQPTVPTLSALVARMAAVPNRRKTIILVSIGLPMTFAPTAGCAGRLADEMKDVFRVAQRANINIHSVDPGGAYGYQEYLRTPVRRGGRPAEVSPTETTAAAARVRRDFLEVTAQYTGAHAVVGLEAAEDGIDRIFGENASYYLLGYQTSNGRPDGKFRRLEVKVNRPGVTVRTRTGYYAPEAGELRSPEDKAVPTTNDLGLSGLWSPAGLPLRASILPVAKAAGGDSRDAEAAIVLTARLPSSGGAATDTITVTRNVYDADGRPGPPAQEKVEVALPASGSDGLRYDVLSRLSLPPGRYQIRLHAHSRLLDRSGAVFVDLAVPDFARARLSLSGISLGLPVPAAFARTDVLADLLPILPTTERDFAPGQAMAAFVRVFQGGDAPVGPVEIKRLVLDARSQIVEEGTETVAAEAFDVSRSAGYQVALPLAKARRGPHVLSLTATLPGGASVRRDVVFRVR